MAERRVVKRVGSDEEVHIEALDADLYPDITEHTTICISCLRPVFLCWCALPEQQREEKARLLLALGFVNNPGNVATWEALMKRKKR